MHLFTVKTALTKGYLALKLIYALFCTSSMAKSQH